MIKNLVKGASSGKYWFLSMLTMIGWLTSGMVWAQKKPTDIINTTAFYSGKYRNLFREADYSQAAIDKKVQQAFHAVFEGPNRVYFEVGDSMAYVSDLKNHDARTEGLSYGMMIAVQLDKKEVFDRIWRWSKNYLQHQSGPGKPTLPVGSTRRP
jgi:oligosaccharide reducing-end xylanase